MKKFYFGQLSSIEQEAYNELAGGFADFLPNIRTRPLPDGTDSALRVIEAVSRDNPGMCFLGLGGVRVAFTSRRASFLPEWLYTQDEARRFTSAMMSAADKILAGIPSGADEYAKEKHIHDHFVRHMLYRDCPETDVRGQHAAHTAIGPLLRSTGVCEGFAKAMTLVLRRAGLQAMYVSGQSAFNLEMGGGLAAGAGSDTGHAWNCVLIGGKSYHMDVTWDNSLTEQDGPIRYDYFNMPEVDIALDHSEFTAPPCNDRDANYFFREGLCVAGKPSLAALLDRAKARKADFVTFKIMPGKTGYPSNVEASVRAAIGSSGIRGCGMFINPYQRAVMLHSISW